MTYPIAHAVGDDHADAFRSIRVRTTDRLLERAGDLKGREELAEQVGLPTSTVLNFVNAADLITRIKRIGVAHVRLLRAAGVKTVRDLKHRNPENLFGELVEANRIHHVVEFMPPQKFVARWVEQAKQLPLRVTYR